MKIRTIPSSMNIFTATEFLVNAIHAKEDFILLDTEMGDLAIETFNPKVYDISDPNFNITISRFKDAAPASVYVLNIIRSDSKDDMCRWYVRIPYIPGQDKDFTRVIAGRAMVMAFMAEALEDTGRNSQCFFRSVSHEDVDTVFAAFWKIYRPADDGYTYNAFNRELCKLSVMPIQRRGSTYRNLLYANRENLHNRASKASSRIFINEDNFRRKCDPKGAIKLGGEFYRHVLATICTAIPTINSDGLSEYYKMLLSKDVRRGENICPIAMIKILLLDKKPSKGSLVRKEDK